MRPFALAPDLAADTAPVSAYVMAGHSAYGLLTQHFGLEDDNRAGLELAAALSAYRDGDMATAAAGLYRFAADPSRLELAERILETLYKAITYRFGDAAPHWVDLVLRLYLAHAGRPEAARLAIEFFVYFGLWEHLGPLRDVLDRPAFLPWKQHLERQLLRIARFAPRQAYSFLLITWNRADLLDRCLAQIRDKAGSRDYEIIVGINGSTDETTSVLARHGIRNVIWNPRNDSIDLYRQVFDAAQGETLIEIDDNVVNLPEGFDLGLSRHLRVFPEYGFIGYEPTRLDSASGQLYPMHAVPDSDYQRIERDGLVVHRGPTWGCCAAIGNRDYRDFGGFYGIRMDKSFGEESQLLRKLRLRGKGGVLIKGTDLIKSY